LAQAPINIQLNKRLFTQKIVGGDSRTNDIPQIEYALSFLKNDLSPSLGKGIENTQRVGYKASIYKFDNL
jgi:hypothetical protein